MSPASALSDMAIDANKSLNNAGFRPGQQGARELPSTSLYAAAHSSELTPFIAAGQHFEVARR
jgi:hypothetical protein